MTLPVWAVGAVTLTATAVLVTGTGLDLLLLVVLLAGVVALERTVGDWTADLLGPALASILLALAAGTAVWLLLSKDGKAEQFYAAAEHSGYGTLFHSRSAPPDPDRPPVVEDQNAGAADQPAAATNRPARISAGSALSIPAPGASQESPRPAGTERLSFFRRSPSVHLAMRIETPEMNVTGKSITIQARVSAGGQPIADVPVNFTVDGRAAGAGLTDRHGLVSTAFVPRVARTYQVQATVSGSSEFRAVSVRSLLYVVPGVSSLFPRVGVLIV